MKQFVPILLLLTSCLSVDGTKEVKQPELAEIETPTSFSNYWSKNGAELSSYSLKQARYGEIHEGSAVMVFVTEPFSSSKQVKLDNYKSAGEDRVNVLKLNKTKKFLTGIYPYSMMMSTFTPLDGSPMIKSATSVQEWCGQTWLQINKQDSGYRSTGFSYFESEGDEIIDIPEVLSEDQIWTQIRLNPLDLPVGDIELLPGSFFLRLRHQPIVAKPCKATITENGSNLTYSLNYSGRSLSMEFEKDLPHRILGWTEEYQSGYGGVLTTEATLINTIRSKYWSKNSNSDRIIREELGLSTKN